LKIKIIASKKLLENIEDLSLDFEEPALLIYVETWKD